jgi:hypothetical protein
MEVHRGPAAPLRRQILVVPVELGEEFWCGRVSATAAQNEVMIMCLMEVQCVYGVG